jgi:hypothetical protein
VPDVSVLCVQVNPVNEAAPVWDTWIPAYVDAVTPYDIPEDSASGTSTVTILATDADEGLDGNVEYVLVSITPSMYSSKHPKYELSKIPQVCTHLKHPHVCTAFL